jgi:hypothetical protein
MAGIAAHLGSYAAWRLVVLLEGGSAQPSFFPCNSEFFGQRGFHLFEADLSRVMQQTLGATSRIDLRP